MVESKFISFNLQEKVVGFDQLGGHDDFSTEMMEWRLGVAGAINYKGDKSAPPGSFFNYSFATDRIQ